MQRKLHGRILQPLAAGQIACGLWPETGQDATESKSGAVLPAVGTFSPPTVVLLAPWAFAVNGVWRITDGGGLLALGLPAPSSTQRSIGSWSSHAGDPVRPLPSCVSGYPYDPDPVLEGSPSHFTVFLISSLEAEDARRV